MYGDLLSTVETPAAAPGTSTSTATMQAALEAIKSEADFDWISDPSIVAETQPSIAIYRNKRGSIVLLREAQGLEEDDVYVLLSTPDVVRTVIGALQRELREMEGGR